MYSLYLTNASSGFGSCIYDPGFVDPIYKVLSPELNLNDNSSGSVEFTVPETHSIYSQIDPMKTTIFAFRDDTEIWEGRVLSVERDFYNRKKVFAEGALSYLNDSIQPNTKYTSCTLAEYETYLIAIHNQQVPANRQITFGSVDESLDYVSDTQQTANRIDRYTSYEKTMDVFNDLVDSYGGHIYVKIENGARVLYHKKLDVNVANASQTINFGKNLLDFIEKEDYSDYASAILPLGKSVDDNNDDPNLHSYIDLNGYSGTVPAGYRIVNNQFLQKDSAVTARGFISQTVRWDDAETQASLFEKAKKYLDDMQNKHVAFEINMVDLHYLNPSIESINLYDMARCYSIPHGLDTALMVTSMKIPMDSPDNTTIKLGFNFDTPISRLSSLSNANLQNQIYWTPNSNVKQNKVLNSSVTIAGVTHSTVEGALGGISSALNTTIISSGTQDITGTTTGKWHWVKYSDGSAYASIHFTTQGVACMTLNGSLYYSGSIKVSLPSGVFVYDSSKKPSVVGSTADPWRLITQLSCDATKVSYKAVQSSNISSEYSFSGNIVVNGYWN